MIKIVILAMLVSFNSIAWAAYTTKTVCHNVKNTKTNKVTKRCKTVKVHKMYQGTKVPTSAPKTTKKPTTKKK